MNNIDQLISKLGDKSRRNRLQAERELVRMGKLVVELLIHALEDDNRTVRCRAASTLGKIKDARAVIPLIRKFADHQ